MTTLTTTTPEHDGIPVEYVAFGSREAMVAEVGAYDHSASEGFNGNPDEYAYLVMPVGEVQFDTEGFATRAEAREQARYLADLCGRAVAYF